MDRSTNQYKIYLEESSSGHEKVCTEYERDLINSMISSGIVYAIHFEESE